MRSSSAAVAQIKIHDSDADEESGAAEVAMRSSSEPTRGEAIAQTKTRSSSAAIAQQKNCAASAAQREPQSITRSVTQRMTQRVFGPMVAAGAAAYVRARDLPKLFALHPEQLADDSIVGTAAIVIRLAALARAQARLGRRRHWSYDLNRHLAVLIALKAERAHLAHRLNAASLAKLVAAAAAPPKPEAA